MTSTPDPGRAQPVPAAAAAEPVRVLQEGDPAIERLLAAGWRTAHRSWGARLPVSRVDAALLRDLVAAATARGYGIEEADEAFDGDLVALAAATRPDFPGGPATAPPEVTRASLMADRAAGTRRFVATRSGRAVAATDVRAGADRVETGVTAVLAAHRRRGLAEAVKAASVLALLQEGAVLFGTGGADEHAASLAMNRRLGYEVVERWLTLAPPS